MLFSILTISNDSVSEPELLDSYLRGIAAGDTDALGNLYHSAKSSVYAYALSVLKNSQDAEDVLHDCFVQVYSAAGSYRSEGKPMAWIMTIAKNLCLKCLRERRKYADDPEEELRELTADGGLSADEKLILGECMKTLTEDERQIVVLHAVSGFKHREIAKFLEIPLSTVVSKYSRATAKLKKIL